MKLNVKWLLEQKSDLRKSGTPITRAVQLTQGAHISGDVCTLVYETLTLEDTG